MRPLLLFMTTMALAAAAVEARRQDAAQPGVRPIAARNLPRGLTAIDGVIVGHHTLSGRPTGCTVVLLERGAVAGMHLPGAAPASRDTELLDPSNLVQQIHAIALSGGSAYGLDTAAGVMRHLEERKVGFLFAGQRVPIVPGASIFDLPVGDDPSIRPDAQCGYQAARQATSAPVAEGSVGAGAGATIGKFAGRERGMKGGVGSADIALPSGLTVAALVVLNAAGDVVDPSTGTIVAGARTDDGRGLIDVRTLLRTGKVEQPRVGEHTTLAVVATNGTLTKAEARAVARMASAGLARSIVPAYTTADGDTVFVVATGAQAGTPNLSVIGALGAEAVADAVLRAAREATGVAGYPALRDLAAGRRR
jgi:L-aminopeptidase/D-esterase-like protein